MSEFWELFEETGDIGYYLLYLESNDQNESSEKNEPEKSEDP